MELKEITNIYKDHHNTADFINELKISSLDRIHLKGLSGSSKSVFIAFTLTKLHGINLFILSDKDEAAYFYNDLINMLGDRNILFFPSSYKRSVQYNQIDNGNIILRTEVLNKLSSLISKNKEMNADLSIVSYPEALIEKVMLSNRIKKYTLSLERGQRIQIESIHDVLEEYKYNHSDFVYEPGQFAIRGGIIDIFSFSNDLPYRLDFFGDEIESIRTFDVETQLSKEHLQEIYILPNLQDNSIEEIRESFLKFIPGSSRIWISDIDFVVRKINELFRNTKFTIETEEIKKIEKNGILITGEDFLEKLKDFTVIESGHRYYFPSKKIFSFNTTLQPVFNKNFNLLGEYLKKFTDKGYTNYVLSDSKDQIERLVSIFDNIDSNIKFKPLFKTIHEGFLDHDCQICCFTDHQIFDRYHKYNFPKYFSNKSALSIKEIRGLQPGDYVVHIDHGIGIFGGLEKIEVNNRFQEAVRLVYKDNDILYVSIHSLHRISKYKGKDDTPPKIYKLGTGAWQKLKQNTKKKVKDIARELIYLYAKRKTQEGFSFSPDTYMQEELEASFLFEDTPDQLLAAESVKNDMEDNTPMDRLVCGDVGFGKTEVAIRAAFKAVADSKQVAVLVPTTILALQHYNTFNERLRDFPCNVDYISRLKKAKDQKDTVKKLEEGRLDILIGTHRLLSKDIKFKDLGLLIIDEEHRFGVIAKERLRQLKLNIDTLTLTATPIPRTMQFSLLGARDFSIVNTPPPNRHPIATELHTFNEDIIKEGIEFEISRNGQVFFLHNRIQNIVEIEALINKLCPGVKTAIAHGQMESKKLEQVMLDFIRGDYDVLVATTIIESGLDIPNANTIFINNAQNYGLSDLHQLRGRVGRSNKKAFCYLLIPPRTFMTPEAKRRLKAIEEYSDLGSGFNLALQDLDIRGAGNLLGVEQSGFITDIGFETYNRILNEAIHELQENEYRDLFSGDKVNSVKTQPPDKFINDCQIDTDLELLFPDDYISNISERIHLYRQLDNIETEEELKEFENQLKDRFGPLPEPTRELLVVVILRWHAVKLGFERIVMKNQKLIAYFISNQDSPYYKSEIFSNILAFVQKNPRSLSMKEINNKLTLTIENINNISEAVGFLKTILNNIT
jgi:transcription-repair coupling factor (superfamily II helicase)